jgi:SulP family sulfate permease
MVKLMSNVRKHYSIQSIVWVTGSDDGFPTEYGLMDSFAAAVENGDGAVVDPAHETTNLISPSNNRWHKYSGNKVAASLDEALLYAEDALLYHAGKSAEPLRSRATSDNELEIARMYLSRLVPEQVDHRSEAIATLFSLFVREEYSKGDCIWMQGSTSDCVKLLVRGELVSVLENEAGTVEAISEGNTIGELGLLQGLPRMSSVYCESANAVAYTLSRSDFEGLCASAPHAARLIDLICIRYLSARVQVRSCASCRGPQLTMGLCQLIQHVSNRIFETRCLPI